jgi:hypothetical protein
MHRLLMTRLTLMFAIVLAGSLVMSAWAAPATQAMTPTQETPALSARVNLIHAAPFAAGAGADVTITATSGGKTVVLARNFAFGAQSGYLNLPAGTYEVKIFVDSAMEDPLDPASTPAFTASLPLVAGKDYTVIATGGGNGYPLNALVLDDTFTAPTGTNGLVRVVHAAPFNSDRAATAVQIREATIGLLSNTLVFEEFRPFLSLPAGTYSLQVETATTPPAPIVGPLPLTIAAGSVTTLVAVGGANAQAPAVVVTPFIARTATEVRVVHAAPFAAGPATASALISPLLSESGAVPLPNVAYKDATPYLAVPAGGYNVKVFAGATPTGTPVIDNDLFIPDGAKLTVVVIGTNTTAYPLRLAILNDQKLNADRGSANVRIFHAAPFGPTAEQTGVDLVAQDGSPLTPPLTNLLYGNDTGYISLPSGVPIDLKVVPTGETEPTLIDPEALTLPSTGVLTVIAIGGAAGIADKTPEVLILTDVAPLNFLYFPIVVRP